jgi:hypothetical protein
VCPFTSSHRGSDERRRNPRRRASSIVYAQLGSDNGGIVVNLGIDGVAFHAARELNSETNSTLDLRLRGSGLNAELVGELVWLSPTKKEAGICFKGLSAKVQQDIADWIARETQLSEAPPVGDRSRLKPMPAVPVPGIFTAEEKSIPHSLSAALAMSQAIPADPPSIVDASANESGFPASSNSAPGISDATPLSEIVSPIQQGHVPALELDDHPQGLGADSSASPAQGQAVQRLHDDVLFEPVPIERPDQFPAGQSSPIVLPAEPVAAVREELPQATAEPPGNSELCKTDESNPIPGDQVPVPPDRLLEVGAAEKWIPPALLAAWRRGNRQQKLLLASTGAACVGIFALILTLAVAQIDSSLSRSTRNGSVQLPTARQPMPSPSASIANVDPPQSGPLLATPAPPTVVQRRSHKPPPPSFLENLASDLGFGPDQSDAKPVIDEDQVGVQVWTSKSSGYYYCTDDAFYKTVQPGRFMTQADALQSGYRSILGQFCD